VHGGGGREPAPPPEARDPTAGVTAPAAGSITGAGWRVLAGPRAALLEPPPAPEAAAVVLDSRDRFADPPGMAVREDVMEIAGSLEPVRAGALADLVDRLEAAGHAIERRAAELAPRAPWPRALLREGAGRFWLWRRRPDRHPLPRPRDVGVWPYPLLVLGALHANGDPTPPVSPGAARRDGTAETPPSGEGVRPGAVRSRPAR
jgi:hypothetical protein